MQKKAIPADDPPSPWWHDPNVTGARAIVYNFRYDVRTEEAAARGVLRRSFWCGNVRRLFVCHHRSLGFSTTLEAHVVRKIHDRRKEGTPPHSLLMVRSLVVIKVQRK